MLSLQTTRQTKVSSHLLQISIPTAVNDNQHSAGHIATYIKDMSDKFHCFSADSCLEYREKVTHLMPCPYPDFVLT